MSLRFFGKDPQSEEDECPSVFVDDTNADLVFQGWNGDEATQDQCRAHGPIADNEGVVRIPARMVSMIRKACDDAERRAAAQLP